nr:sensor histidine kinase [uncultured Undibacterium sp.]
MLQGWLIILVSLVYLAVLFLIAWVADRRADAGRSLIANPQIYALSLGVYCTTWTFYGSVGRAASNGVDFLPIYLGPTLLFALAGFVVLKMIRVSKVNRITSIADLIASRYGKSQLLGGLVTVIAVVGVVPYIALQLKAVSNSFGILVRYPEIVMPTSIAAVPLLQDGALYTAAILACFTIFFGTRHLDATERHEGMVAAIAFESVVKLVAFLAVGIFVVWGMHEGVADIFSKFKTFSAIPPPVIPQSSATAHMSSHTPLVYGSWGALVFLSMLASLLLPRQFQIAVVENVNESHLKRAVWLFPLYLFLINLFVLPVAMAGLLYFPSGVDADTFVLTLPMAQHQQALALLAYIGGLSAATGMVIVETIALATMICNDLLMPVLLRFAPVLLSTHRNLSRVLLTIRRVAIVLILALSYGYFRFAGEAYALVSIGLISFAAVAQFAPAVLGGLYWKGGTRNGAVAGLLAGFSVWMYTLLLPSFAKSGWLPAKFMESGFFGIEMLHPLHLFGLGGLDVITHCIVWSLLANLSAYIGVSLMRAPNVGEARQANLFVSRGSQAMHPGTWSGGAKLSELIPLVSRFLGAEHTNEAFARYAHERGFSSATQLPADAQLVNFAEALLAGAIGSASARAMLASVVTEEALDMEEVMSILDEASQLRSYSREIEEKSRELTRATAELRDANQRLQQLDQMKDYFVATVTHELRTPLTSIRLFSEILHDDPSMTVNERTRFLSIIVSETERLSRLINQILDMAKLESGRGEWVISTVDVAELILSASTALTAISADRQIALNMDQVESGLVVMADRDRLIQVMQNLLSNAFKFVPATGGVVTVSASSIDSDVLIRVCDNGPGINAADHELIFEKFHQGAGNRDSHTDKPKGTGLGLPISRQIVEHFGGRLWAEAAPHGANGACFCFTLPRHVNNKLDQEGVLS